MGKGTIISHKGEGEYSVRVNLNATRKNAVIANLNDKIAEYEFYISGMEDGEEKSLLKLRKAGLEKKKEQLEKLFEEDPTVDAWCGDLTTDLSGEVGLIEIPGQRQYLNIQPGYDGNAAYDADRDGQLQPAIGGTPAGVFYNLAMQPGWQKYKPTYRYGTITAIDYDNDRCEVDLDPAISTIMGINVNQATSLSDVPIEYMDCDSAAFKTGDEVIVKFEDQDWDNPKVIGFRDHPKPCGQPVVVTLADWAIVINPKTGDYYEDVTDNDGNVITSWPVLTSNITDWLDGFTDLTDDLFDAVHEYNDTEMTGCVNPGDSASYDSEAKSDCPDTPQNTCSIGSDDTGFPGPDNWYWGEWDISSGVPSECNSKDASCYCYSGSETKFWTQTYRFRNIDRAWHIQAEKESYDYYSFSGISKTGVPSDRKCYLIEKKYDNQGYESECVQSLWCDGVPSIYCQKYSPIDHVSTLQTTVKTPLGDHFFERTHCRAYIGGGISYPAEGPYDVPAGCSSLADGEKIEYAFGNATFFCGKNYPYYGPEPNASLNKGGKYYATSTFFYKKKEITYEIDGDDIKARRACHKSDKTAVQIYWHAVRSTYHQMTCQHFSTLDAGGDYFEVIDEEESYTPSLWVRAAVKYMDAGIDGQLNPWTMTRNLTFEQRLTEFWSAVRTADGWLDEEIGPFDLAVSIYG